MKTQPDTRNMDQYDPLLAAYNDGDGNQTQQPAHSPLPLDSISCGNYSNAMVEDLAKTHAETLEQLQMAQDALKARDAFAKRLEKRVRQVSQLAEALRDIRDCAYDPDQVAEISYDPNAKPIGEWIGQGNFALGKFASRIYSVAKAALAAWEAAQ